MVDELAYLVKYFLVSISFNNRINHQNNHQKFLGNKSKALFRTMFIVFFFSVFGSGIAMFIFTKELWGRAAAIVASCSEQGFPVEDLYLDPIVLPVNVAQSQMKDILETIHEFKIISAPSPKSIVGLSNVSQGTCVRSLVNRIFLTMAVAFGLDAAILDPTDKDLMDAAITAELILNKQIYCDSYLDAYRKK